MGRDSGICRGALDSEELQIRAEKITQETAKNSKINPSLGLELSKATDPAWIQPSTFPGGSRTLVFVGSGHGKKEK